MQVQYVHVKTRSQFGKQCVFDDEGPMIDENILPDRQLMDDYIYRNPCHVGSQNTKQLATHEVQTTSAPTRESGMSHIEGGWPKELNPKDQEVTARFRRRIEKDDIWPIKMKKLMEPMEHCVLQNNAVNIYENFFDDMVMTELVLPLEVRAVNVYEDPQTLVRPITHLSWSPDRGKRLAVAYCSREFQRETIDRNPWSYIWEIENPNRPYMALKAFCPSVTVEFNPRDPSMLISGLMSGQVCNWDIRQGDKPAQISHLQFSHRNPANLALWINSKTNTEFFSASTGGAIKWWDLRKLREPTETLVMDLENPARGDYVRAIGVSSLQYEPTMGTKFMAGMENGMVVSGTRKGKNAQEKLALRFKCHAGPVITIDRNPFSTKNFLTVGGWIARIWAEDTKEGNLASIKRDKTAYTGGCWSTSRYSVFYLIDESGVMKIYDLLVGMKSPVKTIRLCESGLRAIAAHEEGNLVAVGNDTGAVYLVESSEALTTNMRNDKSLMTTYLDRSSRYVKAVDNRLKEIRVVQRLSIIEPKEEPISAIRERWKSIAQDPRMKDTNNQKVEEKGKGTTTGAAEEKDKKSKVKVKTRETQMSRGAGDPELEEAETRYFEIINNEIEKYAEIAALEEATNEAVEGRKSSARKDSKRRKHEDSKVEKDPSGGGTKGLVSSDKRSESVKGKGRKSSAPGKLIKTESKTEEIVIVRKTKEDRKKEEKEAEERAAQDEEKKRRSTKINERKDELDKTTDEYDYDTDVTDEKEESKQPTIRDKSKVKARKKSKKRGAPELRIKMKKPCDDYVCQPDICCIDEIATERARKKKDEEIEKPIETLAEDSETQIMIDKMLANLPKVATPEEIGHLLDPIADEEPATSERLILAKKNARPSLLDEQVKIAKREYLEWKEATRSHELMKSLKSKRANEDKLQEATVREIFEEIVEPHVTRDDSQIIDHGKKSSVRMPDLDDIVEDIDDENDDDDDDDDESTRDQERYTKIKEKRVGGSKKAKIPIDCEPLSVKFGAKEIKRIIGVPDAPKPSSTPRFDGSKKKIVRTKGDYPRISAAALPKLEKRDSDVPPK